MGHSAMEATDQIISDSGDHPKNDEDPEARQNMFAEPFEIGPELIEIEIAHHFTFAGESGIGPLSPRRGAPDSMAP